MTQIENAKILIIATDGFEQSELFEPYEKLKEYGAEVIIAAPKEGSIKGWDKTDWGKSIKVDMTLETVNADQFDALVLPGGVMNPDNLRANKTAIAKIYDFVAADKIVAAICHAPWLLVEAGVARGRDMTSYHTIKTDIINAGANWKDEKVVVSNGIITSRNPDDIPAFIDKIVEEIREGEHERKVA
ncbi:type 1 glutamine amidotransferase domain-containing protein [Aquisalinus flavus]|uniref:Protease n=1 Tax=Aquisalinus flavus TaxID=1526572 RepID=A0A8J2V600_9PROT|nr:type 1 glutamine amidotransferase domain-containing protein [Aquisalinus flavus]MBD0426463.1 type 1 glutamine amidotransferase [Aquisalinus flavus]UNE47983.1 type 1 glutamine amidotransferase [Aquisalinus flavus]GGD07716.1 protease [Aquisalinus flavus]